MSLYDFVITVMNFEVRKRASESYEDGHPNQTVEWKLHICSENNFPTAAGLASSAAGYACLGRRPESTQSTNFRIFCVYYKSDFFLI